MPQTLDPKYAAYLAYNVYDINRLLRKLPRQVDSSKVEFSSVWFA